MNGKWKVRKDVEYDKHSFDHFQAGLQMKYSFSKILHGHHTQNTK